MSCSLLVLAQDFFFIYLSSFPRITAVREHKVERDSEALRNRHVASPTRFSCQARKTPPRRSTSPRTPLTASFCFVLFNFLLRSATSLSGCAGALQGFGERGGGDTGFSPPSLERWWGGGEGEAQEKLRQDAQATEADPAQRLTPIIHKDADMGKNLKSVTREGPAQSERGRGTSTAPRC
jgi:hypothetical protein